MSSIAGDEHVEPHAFFLLGAFEPLAKIQVHRLLLAARASTTVQRIVGFRTLVQRISIHGVCELV